MSKTKLVAIDKRGRVVPPRDVKRREAEWPFQRATAFASPAVAAGVARQLRATGRAPRRMRRYGHVLTRVYADTDPALAKIARIVGRARPRKRTVKHHRSR